MQGSSFVHEIRVLRVTTRRGVGFFLFLYSVRFLIYFFIKIKIFFFRYSRNRTTAAAAASRSLRTGALYVGRPRNAKNSPPPRVFWGRLESAGRLHRDFAVCVCVTETHG